MKTKILKISSVFVAVIIAFSCFTFSISADTGTVYAISHQKPNANNYDGYLEVLMKNPSQGGLQVYTYYWNISGFSYNTNDTTVFPVMYFRISSSSITFDYLFSAGNSDDDFYFGLLYGFVRSVDGAYIYDYQGSSSSNCISGNFWVPEWLEVIGVKVYGNGVISNSHLGSDNGGSWSVVYGADNVLYNQLEIIKTILAAQNNNDIIVNQDKNTDRIINSGSDKAQPDFGAANTQLDSTTAEMQAVENGYKIDEAATTQELNKGSAFISSTDMQRASVQVKSWIEEFASENKVFSSFLVAALCLGLCFWVIGRKTSK